MIKEIRKSIGRVKKMDSGQIEYAYFTCRKQLGFR